MNAGDDLGRGRAIAVGVVEDLVGAGIEDYAIVGIVAAVRARRGIEARIVRRKVAGCAELRHYAGVEMDLVALAAGEILYQVAVARSGHGGEQELVGTGATNQRIDARPTVDRVVAGSALKKVGVAAAGNLGGASAVGYGEVLEKKNKARVSSRVETATA